jgi:hypothetical protein
MRGKATELSTNSFIFYGNALKSDCWDLTPREDVRPTKLMAENEKSETGPLNFMRFMSFMVNYSNPTDCNWRFSTSRSTRHRRHASEG